MPESVVIAEIRRVTTTRGGRA